MIEVPAACGVRAPLARPLGQRDPSRVLVVRLSRGLVQAEQEINSFFLAPLTSSFFYFFELETTATSTSKWGFSSMIKVLFECTSQIRTLAFAKVVQRGGLGVLGQGKPYQREPSEQL